jgi:mannose-6-phosphate isomerase-like protein (cupin superfamily)
MRKLVTAVLSAFVFSGLAIDTAIAQEKKADKGAPKAALKVVQENDKVRAYEVTFAPGAQNTAVPSKDTRVVRALSSGTLERTYTDGKKEKVEYKTGDVRINNPSPAYTVRNIGKTEVKLYVVQVK